MDIQGPNNGINRPTLQPLPPSSPVRESLERQPDRRAQVDQRNGKGTRLARSRQSIRQRHRPAYNQQRWHQPNEQPKNKVRRRPGYAGEVQRQPGHGTIRLLLPAAPNKLHGPDENEQQ